MACGTPVIGSNVGGIKYSVAEGETGLLVPAEDPEALAEKITELVNNEELLNIMSKNAIKRVNTYFTWARVAQQVEALYKNFIPVAKERKVLLSVNKSVAA